jgi:arginase
MRSIKLLGIPFDFGQDHFGVRMAADFLKDSGLKEKLKQIAPVRNLGNINLPFREKDSLITHSSIKSSRQASNANQEISRYLENEDLSDNFLLNIGGDHGMALGTIHGILAARPDTVVIWADAHGDINTPETSPTGNFHGMPLAFLLNAARHEDFQWMKNFIRREKLILIGPRDLDQGEKDIIQKLSIQYFSSQDLNTIGAKEIIEMALHRADPLGTCPIHLSFDVDLCDQKDIKSTGTRVPDGPKLEEIFLLGGVLAQTGRLKSMDVVEFNPLIGSSTEVLASSELIIDFITTTIRQVFSESNIKHHFLLRAFTKTFLQRDSM